MRQKSIAVIIVAAGKGERASADGAADPKQYRPLAGIPVLARSPLPAATMMTAMDF